MSERPRALPPASSSLTTRTQSSRPSYRPADPRGAACAAAKLSFDATMAIPAVDVPPPTKWIVGAITPLPRSTAPSVADLDSQSVEEDHRIDGIERPILPLANLFKDSVGDAAEQVGRDVDGIQSPQEPRNH
jgi:hypothetical protein